MPMSGQCLCGSVTLTVSDAAEWIGVCHCETCRKWSGGLWAGFPVAADNVVVDGPVKTYPSSAIAERAFCETCGTQLWMRDIKEGADYDLMPGIFDATQKWPLHSEIYTDQALTAFTLKGDHRRASAEEYRAKNPHVKDI